MLQNNSKEETQSFELVFCSCQTKHEDLQVKKKSVERYLQLLSQRFLLLFFSFPPETESFRKKKKPIKKETTSSLTPNQGHNLKTVSFLMILTEGRRVSQGARIRKRNSWKRWRMSQSQSEAYGKAMKERERRGYFFTKIIFLFRKFYIQKNTDLAFQISGSTDSPTWM